MATTTTTVGDEKHVVGDEQHVVLHEKQAYAIGGETAAKDRETDYTNPASHLDPNDPVKVSLDEEIEFIDIFSPLPPLEGVPEEKNPLTLRAVLIGCILGSLVNCSNVYLGMLDS